MRRLHTFYKATRDLSYLILIELLFESRDCWIGLYWTRDYENFYPKGTLHLYFVIVPMLPLHILLVPTLAPVSHFRHGQGWSMGSDGERAEKPIELP